jgi:hypothetical protein
MSDTGYRWKILHRTDWGHRHDSLVGVDWGDLVREPPSNPDLKVIEVMPVAEHEAEVARLRQRIATMEGRAHPMDFDSPAYD